MKVPRIVTPIVATTLGLAIGIAADFVSPSFSVSARDLMVAILFAPILVIAGSGAVDSPLPSTFVIAGGLLFWPVWGALVWKSLRDTKMVWAVLTTLWSAQGFFQLLHRFAAIMSA